ncbi:MAG: NUDIX hydrolase [Actinomycetota bacterium]
MSLRRASTVCVVRDNDGVEVLMVRRPLTARFMPGAWVFPGGAVDEEDVAAPPSFGPQGEEHDWKVAALRELIEETGLWVTTEGVVKNDLVEDAFEVVEQSDLVLDPGALTYFANWITPRVFPIRFDTRFFLAVADPGTGASVDGDELIDHDWVTPTEALRREVDREWDVSFPTRKILISLASAVSVDDLVERLSAVGEIPAIEPRLFVGENEAKILLPDEAGFDEAGPAQDDPTILERLSAVVAQEGTVPAEFKSRS